jgi:hypothetical protein
MSFGSENGMKIFHLKDEPPAFEGGGKIGGLEFDGKCGKSFGSIAVNVLSLSAIIPAFNIYIGSNSDGAKAGTM